MELTLPKSSAISKILYRKENNTFDITFNSGNTTSYGGGTDENFEFCKEQFQKTQSVGKTFHSLVNSGKLSVNGNVV